MTYPLEELACRKQAACIRDLGLNARPIPGVTKAPIPSTLILFVIDSLSPRHKRRGIQET